MFLYYSIYPIGVVGFVFLSCWFFDLEDTQKLGAALANFMVWPALYFVGGIGFIAIVDNSANPGTLIYLLLLMLSAWIGALVAPVIAYFAVGPIRRWLGQPPDF